MKRKNLVLGVLVGLALAGFSSIGFAKDVDNQPVPTRDTAQQAFPGFSDKLNNLLMDQLAALGYDPAVMAEEAKSIDSIKDDAEQAKATDWFYNKYRSMAIQGLYRMAALAKSSEAEDWLINVERALQASSPTPQENLPQSIFDIYQQIDGSQTIAVLSATDSSCITPMVRAGCFLALLGNEECAYVHQSTTISSHFSIAPIEQRFPTGNILLRNPGSSGSVHFNDIDAYIVHDFEHTNFDHDINYRAGFHWPLKATDHTMCIDIAVQGLPVAQLSTGETDEILSSISAVTGVGYARATSAWSMTLDGNGISRSARNCGFFHEVSSDTTSDDASDINRITAIPHVGNIDPDDERACWFRNLGDVFNRTYPARTFPATQDPETWGAASVDITSNVSSGMYYWGNATAHERTYIKIGVYGVLVVRDRQ